MNNDIEQTVQPTDDILHKIHNFCFLFVKHHAPDLVNTLSTYELLDKFLEIQAMYVSPGDLCYHTTNLSDLKKLEY